MSKSVLILKNQSGDHEEKGLETGRSRLLEAKRMHVCPGPVGIKSLRTVILRPCLVGILP